MIRITSEDTLFEEDVKAIIPAGHITEVDEAYYHSGEWEPTNLKLTHDKIIFETESERKTVKLNTIFYMDRELNFRKSKERHTLNFTYMERGAEKGYLVLVKTRSKKELKRKMLKEMMKRARLNYIAPYKIEDQVYEEANWKEGRHRIRGSKHIQIIGEGNRLIAIPRNKIYFVSPGEIKGKNALKIFYEKDEELRVDILSPVNLSLSIVTEYFQNCFLKKEQRIPTLSDRELRILKILNSLEKNEVTLASELSEIMDIEMIKLKETLEGLKEKKLVNEQDIIVNLTEIGRIVGDKKLGFDRFDEEKLLEEKDRLDKIAELISQLEKLKEN